MRRERMQQLSVEVTVGAFLFLVLFALGFFTIVLSTENWFTEKYHYEVVFENVSGLSEGDSVAVRGLKVGLVQRLWLEADGVHARASLEKPLDLREDYEVTILASSVLGGRYMLFDEGTPGAPQVAKEAVLRGTMPVDLMEEAGRIVRRIEEALVEGGILDNLEATMVEFRSLTTKLNAGEGTLGRLLTDRKVYDDLESTVAGLRRISEGLEAGEGTLGKLLTDDGLYTNITATAENLRALSDRLEEGKGTIGKLLSEDETLYHDLKEAVASLRDLSGRLNSGEGTLGRLMSDDELYEEAKLLLNDIRAAVDDFRETAPLTSFSSIFFGAF